MALQDLRKNDMMAHLLDALEQGKDIGHYGRLVFTMVAQYFLDDEEIVKLLKQDQDFSEEQARGLVEQVRSRGYNPPRRERILQWQKEQKFPICPSDDPDACNVYRNLNLPEEIFRDISRYHEEKANA
jgi:DNA primase large subunit